MGKQQRAERLMKIARQRNSPVVRTHLKRKSRTAAVRVGRAPEHGPLADGALHVFVDDQNLFWGIVNDLAGPSYRLDFGQLLTEVSKDSSGRTRPVRSAYIAGVIPDDDSFWRIAENQGFQVRRGYLGTGGRSKQDDAFLITEMVSVLHEQKGPATMVLVAGDADYFPPLKKALERGWRTEVVFVDRGVSVALESAVHQFRTVHPVDIELLRGRTVASGR